jgi:hypothetical protein
MVTVNAIALVGFYRGEQLVEPGQVIALPGGEFAELRAFQKVDYAPAAPVAEVKAKAKAKAG